MESDGPWSANLVLELWLRKNSEPRFKLLEKAYLERHRGGRNKLYKEWAQETSHRGKEEPLELRREKGPECAWGEKGLASFLGERAPLGPL